MKYLLGETSAWEEQAVKKWLADDPANQGYFDQLRLIWDTSKQLALESTASEQQAWKRFQQRIHTEEPTISETTKTRNFSWMRIAAAAVLIIGVALISYVVINGLNKPTQLTLQSTEKVINDTLPDGTMVTLNKKSALTYPTSFKGKSRTVTMKGEVFFNVTPDKSKPFIIEADGTEITVVGTSFNVKTENGTTEVVVETGTVKVVKDGKEIILQAGERTIVSATIAAPEKQGVKDKLYNYYRSHQFVCDETPLWKLVEVLNEAYHSNIVIDNPSIRELKLNTTFNEESLDRVLDLIKETFANEQNITIIRSGDKIILK